MPQPPLNVTKYLAKGLPQLRESYPPGTGGTGPRETFEGSLKGVQVIDDFKSQTKSYSSTLPQEPVQPHPNHKYPKIVQVISKLPQSLKSPADLQKSLSTLPLAAVSAALTALEVDAEDAKVGAQGARALDAAGYESDGGEELDDHSNEEEVAGWVWKFNKSPIGSGEFLLVQQGTEQVKCVVRTINSSAFTTHDWAEYVVNGKYRYNTKSKASWYWSRSWGACNRLKCKYFVLTDWQRWVFGTFDDAKEQGYVSPILTYDAAEPSIGQALLYWTRSAIGDSNGFKPTQKDVSSEDAELFPDNPARRVSVTGSRPKTVQKGIKKANESDIEESDAEGA